MHDGIVEFLGRSYPIKSIMVPTWGRQLISTSDLQDKLLVLEDDLCETGADIYVSMEAKKNR